MSSHVYRSAEEQLQRDAWLEERRTGLGGSDLAGVLGYDRYRTPMAVYLDKIGVPDPAEEGPPAMAIEAGNRLEPVVVEWTCERMGLAHGPFHEIMRHAEEPWRLANPDRYVYPTEDPLSDRGVLEAKAPGYWQRGDWDDGQVPIRAFVQLQWYLDVLGWQWGVVGGLIGGQLLRHERFTYDAEFADLIRAEARRFWHEHVLERVPPPARSGDREILEAAYDLRAGAVVHVTELPDPARALELVAHYRRIRRLIRDLEDRKEQTASQLAEILATVGGERLVDDRGMLVKWEQQTTSRLDQKLLREHLPMTASTYTTQRTTRPLNVTTRKEL